MTTDVTRLEIAQHLEPLFAAGPADRQTILTAVAPARPEVGQVLQELPERQFTSLRQVWGHLPHVPVGI
ncbi:hypothetical protein [Streptomyces sp. URMC 125]|uniref:hypothetical protein n=1 Tax=Streptomyces sp. URMC 125 TaxID=3423419 RepID=UPI003F19E04B